MYIVGGELSQGLRGSQVLSGEERSFVWQNHNRYVEDMKLYYLQIEIPSAYNRDFYSISYGQYYGNNNKNSYHRELKLLVLHYLVQFKANHKYSVNVELYLLP